MKRSLRIALTLALALAVSTASAFATVVSASFNKINIEVEGSLKAVSGEYFVRTTGDVPYSILYMGTTYLPLAKVCEFVGKDVSWDGNTRTVTISNPSGPVDGAPDSTAEPKAHQAVSIAKKGLSRSTAGEDPRKTLQRVMNTLVRRGYDWETARQACQTAIRELREEE